MKIIIRNVKFGEFAYPDMNMALNQIRGIIMEKLESHKILSSMTIDKAGSAIVFGNIPDKEPRKLFLSARKNHVELPEDDPRKVKLGRNYLETYRLTRKQSNLVWNEIINATLDNMGVSCEVVAQEFDDDERSLSVLREGFSWGAWKYKDKNAPKQGKWTDERLDGVAE